MVKYLILPKRRSKIACNVAHECTTSISAEQRSGSYGQDREMSGKGGSVVQLLVCVTGIYASFLVWALVRFSALHVDLQVADLD